MTPPEIEYSDSVYFSAKQPSGAEPEKFGNYSITMREEFKGHRQTLEHPRDGISLFMNDFCLENDIMLPYEVGEGALTISTFVSGKSFYAHKGQSAIDVQLVKPCDMAIYTDSYKGELHLKGKESFRSVGIYVSKELILGMTEGEDRFADLEKALSLGGGSYTLGMLSPLPQTQLSAMQMLECSLTGSCRRLFMEGKCLEMISTTLDRLAGKSRPGRVSLSRDDIDRIHEARRLLTKDMVNPPSIKELSKAAAINEFKLKNGFREVFGCTVYQVLRTHRLETARIMLADSNMTVGTVASMVGYTNMSHFIAAYRKHFGVTPGSLLRNSRRSLLG